jgi:hypothetical protein
MQLKAPRSPPLLLLAVSQTPDQNQGNLWLALRVLWNGAWQQPMVQHTIVSIIGHASLASLLRHWSEAIQQRSAGVILNLCVGIGLTADSRKAFWATSAPWDLCSILKSAVKQASLARKYRLGSRVVRAQLHCVPYTSSVYDGRFKLNLHAGVYSL